MAETELSDQEILALTQQLQEEEASKSPLIADPPVTLQALRDEYVHGSDLFIRKINHLIASGYTHIRRTRGDGSCFYRSLAFRWLERLWEQSRDKRDQAIVRLAVLDTQIATFADPDILNDFAEPVVRLLNASQKPNLVQAFNDPETSNAAVVYFRLITSSQLRTDSDDVFPYLFSYEDDNRILDPTTQLPSVVRFCEHFVEAMGRDADHIMIQSLAKALDLTLDIACLDQSKGTDCGPEGAEGYTTVDLIHFQGGQFDLGSAALLLRPGHYDILLKGL